jgi:two-component system KDP operon response regulator KdpE
MASRGPVADPTIGSWEAGGLAQRVGGRTILIVGDDTRRAALLSQALIGEGHNVVTVAANETAARKVTEVMPDLVILEEPAAAGVDVLAAIRRGSSVPIIVESADDDEMAKVAALDRGADEYVVAPCGERELCSRVRAALRRALIPGSGVDTRIVIDTHLAIDFSRHQVFVAGRRVGLRPTEYRLLYHLVNNAGRVLTHETLLAKVWGYEYRTEEHYVRLYVTYLRQKIEPDPHHPRYILNERGLGYRFCDPRELRQEAS